MHYIISYEIYYRISAPIEFDAGLSSALEISRQDEDEYFIGKGRKLHSEINKDKRNDSRKIGIDSEKRKNKSLDSHEETVEETDETNGHHIGRLR